MVLVLTDRKIVVPGAKPDSLQLTKLERQSMYYEVRKTGQIFESFFEACRAGEASKSEVYEVNTGIRRWYPAEDVSAKNMRYYEERIAAYKAQQSLKS